MGKLVYARKEELAEIWQLFVEAKRTMQTQGIGQWTDDYPNKEIIERDIVQRQLLIYKNEAGEIVSTGTLCSESLESEESHGYNGHTKCIHRLVTKASKMGNGFGTTWLESCLKDFCESGDVIYSLTNHTNKPMQHLFEKAGFSVIDTTSITGREPFGPFYIYKRNR
ncbi:MULTISPECIES: GNAT family N-acetyltransferase [Enterococcus]|jgi:predicted GNAT family N-acyltransferase|uniref:Acetyltransferase (GNAT) family n=1 Tax=Enterococcus gallinarum TaxID=1353 RepID=A0A376H4K7_ENTGA|nr:MULTISPECIES: GNAT family N-acetyltransferase [Enterococcus]OJG49451.1 hypothetical protein RV03_GL003564 [Enterococcus gallinarum]STD84872.1 Acetyltransferase (GNAT) family [Enterococcus gallinarum]STD86976.1 Acetyltransferase (GNAT) family [Enterococcus gallinarum]